MSISQLTLKSNDEEPVRRFEVFTGSGRRREWSDEQKVRIPVKPAADSETKPATHSDFIPASIPI